MRIIFFACTPSGLWERPSPWSPISSRTRQRFTMYSISARRLELSPTMALPKLAAVPNRSGVLTTERCAKTSGQCRVRVNSGSTRWSVGRPVNLNKRTSSCETCAGSSGEEVDKYAPQESL